MFGAVWCVLAFYMYMYFCRSIWHHFFRQSNSTVMYMYMYLTCTSSCWWFALKYLYTFCFLLLWQRLWRGARDDDTAAHGDVMGRQRFLHAPVVGTGRVGADRDQGFQPFFVSLTLPYSVIRNEMINLPVTVFNYLSDCLNVSQTKNCLSDCLGVMS